MIAELLLALILIVLCFGTWYSKRDDYHTQQLIRVLDIEQIKKETSGIVRQKKTVKEFAQECVPEPVSESQHIEQQTHENPFENIGRNVEEI